MVDKTRCAFRQHAENADRNSTRSIRVTLPTFAVLVLRQRARDRRLNVSAVIEELILETIMLDELQAMARRSPDFAHVAEDWFRDAVAGKR
jgi:post-segregation antitoxin (ccd killing protein)